jgi:hypothetical protein
MRTRWVIATVIVGVIGFVVVSNGAATADLTTLAVATRGNAHVSLAASGELTAAVWAASTERGETDVFAAVSRDHGRTFSAPVRVNSTPGDVRVNGEQPPRIALRARTGARTPEIAVVWTTKRPAGTVLLQAISRDGGRSFTASALVPGSDAPGNRGWEGLGVGPDGRFVVVWLDHRKLAQPQSAAVAGEHHHEGAAMPAAAAAAGKEADGVAMAQLSQLYVSSLDGGLRPIAVTGGVCYCCKTAVVAGPGNTLQLAWRHVYPGNLRDIAFAVSRDGGRTFAAPVRISEDHWRIEGCPDDGPSMAVDGKGVTHIVWPSVVTEPSGPVKALFHASSADGRSFSARHRLPTKGQANHPQLSIDSRGQLAVTWDESGSGSRVLAAAISRTPGGPDVRFERVSGDQEIGTYPSLVSVGAGRWLRAWTSGSPSASVIRLGFVE